MQLCKAIKKQLHRLFKAVQYKIKIFLFCYYPCIKTRGVIKLKNISIF